MLSHPLTLYNGHFLLPSDFLWNCASSYSLFLVSKKMEGKKYTSYQIFLTLSGELANRILRIAKNSHFHISFLISMKLQYVEEKTMRMG